MDVLHNLTYSERNTAWLDLQSLLAKGDVKEVSLTGVRTNGHWTWKLVWTQVVPDRPAEQGIVTL